MNQIDITPKNKIQPESKPEQIEESWYVKAWKYTKVLFVYSLMIATAVMYVLWHSEQKARSMERDTYQNKIQELDHTILKHEAYITELEKTQTSFLNKGQ